MNLVQLYEDVHTGAVILFDTDDEPEIWNFMLDTIDDHVKSMMHPDGYWYVHIPEFGWTKRSTTGRISADNAGAFMLQAVLPRNTSASGEIRVFKDRIEAMVSYHDAPTGELRIIRPTGKPY